MKKQEIIEGETNNDGIDYADTESFEHLFNRPEGTVREEIYASGLDVLLGDYEYSFFFEKNNDQPIGVRIGAYYNPSLYDTKINEHIGEDISQSIQGEYSLTKNMFVTFNTTSIENNQENVGLYVMLNY